MKNTDIQEVDINLVHANLYNPNKMDSRTYKLTLKSIEEDGLIGAILVREHPDKPNEFMIIDGEHRWRAAKELGYKKIKIEFAAKDTPEAMISTLRLNKTRGENDPIKEAEVIHEIHKTYSTEEIEDKLGYTKEEQQGLENLMNFDFSQVNQGQESGANLPQDPPQEYKFEIILTDKQHKIVETALEKIGQESTADGLVKICLEFLKKHGNKSSS